MQIITWLVDIHLDVCAIRVYARCIFWEDETRYRIEDQISETRPSTLAGFIAHVLLAAQDVDVCSDASRGPPQAANLA